MTVKENVNIHAYVDQQTQASYHALPISQLSSHTIQKQSTFPQMLETPRSSGFGLSCTAGRGFRGSCEAGEFG